jgi:hypothetical protein
MRALKRLEVWSRILMLLALLVMGVGVINGNAIETGLAVPLALIGTLMRVKASRMSHAQGQDIRWGQQTHATLQ